MWNYLPYPRAVPARPLPTVFVSHGAPTLSLNPGATGAAWQRLARSLARPKAILCVSAHWDTSVPVLSSTLAPETIHDFSGFPRELFEIEYRTRGDVQLARRVHELLGAAGIAADVDSRRGLDHGAWVPLRFMFPDGDVPVIQLAVQSELGAAHHAQLGAALLELAFEGVLVLASGSATHNLRDVDWNAPDDRATHDYVPRFQTWLREQLTAGDSDALIDYRRRAPDGVRAHPTEDHFVPLFVALAAAGAAPRVERVHTGITYGVLGMDIFTFTPQ